MAKTSNSSLVDELIARRAMKDKKGRSTSCLLCQKRKQKCDHRMPSCTTCIKAGVQCIQPEKYSARSPVKDEYTVILERRILYLESFIDDKSLVNMPEPEKYKKLTPFIQTHKSDEQSIKDDDLVVFDKMQAKLSLGSSELSSLLGKSTSLSVIEPVPLTRTNTFDPQYSSVESQDDFGISSLRESDIGGSLDLPTFSLMNDPMRQLPKMDDKGKPLDFKPPGFLAVASLSEDSLNYSLYVSQVSIAGSVDLSETILGKYDFKEFLSQDPEFDIDVATSQTLLDTHFTRFQYKFPFLDAREVYDFFHAWSSKSLAGYMNDMDYFHFACCRMWLIFSLNLFILKTSGEYTSLQPLKYISTALRYLSKCKITDPFQQIEIYLLMILCLIRCDRESIELYRIVSDAMKVVTQTLHLHEYNTYLNCLEKERTQKMKSFWCVYLLERLVSVSIGKPFSFPEKLIDSGIPLFDLDPASMIPESSTTKTLFINQSIRLKRIEAKAIETLNIIGSNSRSPTESELPLVEHYFEQLQNWRIECKDVVDEVAKATLGLYYFRTVRVLIQPYLELMEPEDRLLGECQAAAGQICQLFKVFHQKTVYGHSTLAIHNVFVAGVTLVYCLWLVRNVEDKRRKKLGDTAKHTRPTMSGALLTSLDDLKACSICLFVMAERSKYAIVFRDTFDQLLSATIGNLVERCTLDSSELVYNTNYVHKYSEEIAQDVPPAIVRKPVTHYDIMSKYTLKDSAYKKGQEEKNRKQGDLEKNLVPKSLSHLLVSRKQLETLPTTIFAAPLLIPLKSASVNIGAIPFTDRANEMISTISTWTEESGPITTNYGLNSFFPEDYSSQNSKFPVYPENPKVKKPKFNTKSLFNGKFNNKVGDEDPSWNYFLS